MAPLSLFASMASMAVIATMPPYEPLMDPLTDPLTDPPNHCGCNPGKCLNLRQDNKVATSVAEKHGGGGYELHSFALQN